jgi:O-acetylhomoserine (thiol)-lyase
VRWSEVDEVAAATAAVGPRTQAILVPSLATTGEVADIEAYAGLAKRAAVPLIVDNTCASPALCQPIAFGADIVIHADGRFLIGDRRAPGLIVDAGRFAWMSTGDRYPVLTEREAEGPAVAERIGNFAYAAAVRAFVGASWLTDPAAALAGLETLPLRMAQHARAGRAVAEFLAGHDAVARVAHPGLAGDRHYALAEKYLAGGGAHVAFSLAAPRETLAASGMQVVREGLSDRSAVSCLSPIASGPASPVPPALLLQVGLEDASDITADLAQVLAGS